MAGDAGQRQVYVDLDGERIATLLDRQSVTVEIAQGPHRDLDRYRLPKSRRARIASN